VNTIGGLDRHEMFPSRFIQPRCVDMWCPPGYAEDSAASFPVIYMHDGQNLFDSAVAYGGSGWEIHRAIAQLMDAGEIQVAIIVGME
jgi:predicted alpha/beta superfamily hydrolase